MLIKHLQVPVALKKKQTVSVDKRVPTCPIQTLNTISTCRNRYIHNRSVMTHAFSDKLRHIFNNKRQYDTHLLTMGRNFDQNHYENAILGFLCESFLIVPRSVEIIFLSKCLFL